MERKEPTLSGIVPEKDNLDSNSPPETPRPGARRTRHEPPPPPPESSGPGFVAVLALLLALVGIGGGGYLFWELNESQKELAEARQRIAGLETRLNIDSDESSQTLEDIQDKLKWADAEIRKLWGVSHDVNRKRIVANEDNIANINRKLSNIEKDAATARAAVTSARRELQAGIDDLKGQIDRASAAMKTLESSAKDFQSLRDELNRISQQMPGLRDLATRVKTNEEAISAIDAYRRNLNSDLLQLRQQIGNTP